MSAARFPVSVALPKFTPPMFCYVADAGAGAGAGVAAVIAACSDVCDDCKLVTIAAMAVGSDSSD